MPSHLSKACSCCVQAFKFLPVIFIVTVLVWSYYSYVILLCFFAVENIFQRIAYLLMYHFLVIMLSWSYWQTIFTPVGLVPKRFQLSASDVEKLERAETQESHKQILEQLAANLPVVTRTTFGVRYCEKCLHIKPDRAHHCSVCGGCVLKMDHHCPWVNNCVGFSNYKYFLLFLGYAVVYCLFVAATTLPYFIKFWKNELDGLTGRFHVLFLFFVALMFAVSLVSLFGYHIFLVLRNRTTLEAFRPPLFRTGPDKNGFSLGKYNNFVEVFGEDKRLWFVPVFTSRGEGSTFPREPELSSTSVPPTYDSMGVTQAPSPVFGAVTDLPSMGDGIAFPQQNLEEDRDTLLGTQQRWTEEGGESSDRSGDDHTVDLVGTSSFSRQSSNRVGSVSVNMEPV